MKQGTKYRCSEKAWESQAQDIKKKINWQKALRTDTDRWDFL